MLKNLHKKQSQSSLEFIALIFFVITALLIIQKYVFRGIAGRWRAIGDSFGHGRLYDPVNTVECGFDRWYDTGLWYNAVCFDETCGQQACVGATAQEDPCRVCIEGCAAIVESIDVCNEPVTLPPE